MPDVQLFGSEFDSLIKSHGIKCKYYPAIVCECITKDSQQPQFTCPHCGGSGFRYLPPIDTRVVVTSFSSKYNHEIMNFREAGTAYATPQPDLIMGFHDRLVFPDFKCKYSERLWISKDSLVTSKSYRNIVDVVTIAKGDMEFEPGIDYEISEDGYHIEFHKPIGELMNDTDLDDEVAISILYYTNPSYLVCDLLHELRAHYNRRYVPSEEFEELPKQYLIKREDFIYEVSDSKQQTQTNEHYEDVSSIDLFD